MNPARGRGALLARLLGGAAWFVVGFGLVAAAWQRVVPLPEEYGLGTKLRFYEEHRDDYDVLFVGSSRVYRSIDPQVFDAVLRERLGPENALSSFNLGVGGMRSYEQDWILHRILSKPGKRLKYVFFEGGDWSPEFDYSFNVDSWRSVNWHTPRETATVLSVLRAHPIEAKRKLWLGGKHVQLMASRLASYGQGGRLVQALRGELEDERGRGLTPELLASQQGFEAADVQAKRLGATAHLEMWKDPKPYLERVAALPQANAAEVVAERVPFEALEAQYAAAERAGCELVVLVPPGYEPTPVRRWLAERGDIPVLFDYNRPELYPELFEREARFDPKHLNKRGAETFSALVAEDFLRRYGGELRDPEPRSVPTDVEGL